MNAEYKDFIAVYRDVYPEGYCQHLIKEFDRLVESGAGVNRQRGEGALKHRKNDMQLGLNFGVHSAADFNEVPVTLGFFDGLQCCYDAYAEEYSILKSDKIVGTAMKMQRTDPGGGYHIWHSEQGNGNHAERVLVYMLYLNTLTPEEAGETEFLYQKRRIQPTENTMVIWPAAFTHAHRGNTVLGERSKYIVTGWFYYE
jgi:2OG-Fe(II) oxygenase superfamily